MSENRWQWHAQKPGGGVLCGDEMAEFVAAEARFRQESGQCPKCAELLARSDKRKQSRKGKP